MAKRVRRKTVQGLVVAMAFAKRQSVLVPRVSLVKTVANADAQAMT